MNAKEFREFGYAAVDFVADYMENVHERFISPNFWVFVTAKSDEINKNKLQFQASATFGWARIFARFAAHRNARKIRKLERCDERFEQSDFTRDDALAVE